MLEAAGVGRQAPSEQNSPEAQSAWPRQPPGTHRLATQVRPEGHVVPSVHTVVGWQCESRQYALAEQSVSTRQRGNSWQIFVAQSKPGGQVAEVKARHSVLGPHSAVEEQVWYSRQRPAVALEQYWPEGQSAFVVHPALVHVPASQMKPAPHSESFKHCRRQSPWRHT
jgi:hypothetical protein